MNKPNIEELFSIINDSKYSVYVQEIISAYDKCIIPSRNIMKLIGVYNTQKHMYEIF